MAEHDDNKLVEALLACLPEQRDWDNLTLDLKTGRFVQRTKEQADAAREWDEWARADEKARMEGKERTKPPQKLYRPSIAEVLGWARRRGTEESVND